MRRREDVVVVPRIDLNHNSVQRVVNLQHRWVQLGLIYLFKMVGVAVRHWRERRKKIAKSIELRRLYILHHQTSEIAKPVIVSQQKPCNSRSSVAADLPQHVLLYIADTEDVDSILVNVFTVTWNVDQSMMLLLVAQYHFPSRRNRTYWNVVLVNKNCKKKLM